MSLYSEDYDRLSEAINSLTISDCNSIQNSFISVNYFQNSCTSNDIVLGYKGVVAESTFSSIRKYRYSDIGKGASFLLGKSPESLRGLIGNLKCTLNTNEFEESQSNRLYCVRYFTSLFDWGQFIDRDVFIGSYKDCKDYLVKVLEKYNKSVVTEINFTTHLIELDFGDPSNYSRLSICEVDQMLDYIENSELFIHTGKYNYVIKEVSSMEYNDTHEMQRLLTQFLGGVVHITIKRAINLNYIEVNSYKELFDNICKRRL